MLKLISKFSGHDQEKVWCVSWSPNGELLASCGSDQKIRIWSKEILYDNLNLDSDHKETWKCVCTLSDGHTRTVRWVAWSPCGKKLASASFDTTITIWRQNSDKSYEIIANLEGHENEVKCTAWSNDGLFLATCSRDRSVWIWDVSDDDEYECSSVLTIHSQDVKHIKWHPFKNYLVSTSYDNSIKLSVQESDDWICAKTLDGHESTVWSSDFSPEGDVLISCSDDKTLKLWKTETSLTGQSESNWQCFSTISGYHDRTIYSVKWSKYNNLIATADGSNSVHIFKYNQNAGGNDGGSLNLLYQKINAHDQDCNCVDWNPMKPNILVTCSDDSYIKIWEFCEE